MELDPIRPGAALSLPYLAPYDWSTTLGFLSARAIPGVERVAEGRYRRSFAIDGVHGTFEVGHDEPRGQLRAAVRFPRPAALPTIIARIRRLFDLDADPVAIGAHLAADPRLAPLVAARPGLRVPRAWDGFELALRAVLGQQVTVRAATALAGKLVSALGVPLFEPANASGLTHVFPEPARLRALSADDLARRLGMPRTRGTALLSIAHASAGNPQLFDGGQALDEAVAALRSLPGIGEWTAQYIAMRALGQADAFPTADVGLLRALADPDTGVRPTPRQLLARAERWRPWRAYAALHLWIADPAGPASMRSAAAAATTATGGPPSGIEHSARRSP